MATALGQDTLTVSYGHQCSECSLGLRRLVSLGDSVGGGRVGYTFGVAETTTHYLVSLIDDPRFVQVFDRLGSFVSRLSPPPGGDSLGDFALVGALAVDARDSLFVFDNGTGAVHVYDPSLAYVRTFGLRGLVIEKGAIMLPEGEILANMLFATPALAGIPVHILDRDTGEPMRAFGDVGFVLLGFNETLLYRWLTLDDEGGFWAAQLESYVIEEWDFNQERPSRIIRGDPAWMESVEEAGEPRVNFVFPPPEPNLLGVWADHASSVLFVMGRKRDPEWRTSLSERWIGEFTRHWDSVLEAVDLKTGQLLVRRCYADKLLLGFLPGGRTFSLVETEGSPQLVVERLEFTRSKGGRNARSDSVPGHTVRTDGGCGNGLDTTSR